MLVTDRTAFTLSAFGEHLIVQELDRAVAEAARSLGASAADYAAGPLFPTAERPRGGHLFVVELSPPAPGQAAAFAATLDTALSRLNADYADHRRDGFGMAAPEVKLVPPGTFAAWMRRRGKLGGQNKGAAGDQRPGVARRP